MGILILEKVDLNSEENKHVYALVLFADSENTDFSLTLKSSTLHIRICAYNLKLNDNIL